MLSLNNQLITFFLQNIQKVKFFEVDLLLKSTKISYKVHVIPISFTTYFIFIYTNSFKIRNI